MINIPRHNQSNHHTTVPQPFNLSSNEQFGQIRRNKALASMKEQESRECTFKPETLEAQNRQLVNQMLHQNMENFNQVNLGQPLFDEGETASGMDME